MSLEAPKFAIPIDLLQGDLSLILSISERSELRCMRSRNDLASDEVITNQEKNKGHLESLRFQLKASLYKIWQRDYLLPYLISEGKKLTMKNSLG